MTFDFPETETNIYFITINEHKINQDQDFQSFQVRYIVRIKE